MPDPASHGLQPLADTGSTPLYRLVKRELLRLVRGDGAWRMAMVR